MSEPTPERLISLDYFREQLEAAGFVVHPAMTQPVAVSVPPAPVGTHPNARRTT